MRLLDNDYCNIHAHSSVHILVTRLDRSYKVTKLQTNTKDHHNSLDIDNDHGINHHDHCTHTLMDVQSMFICSYVHIDRCREKT